MPFSVHADEDDLCCRLIVSGDIDIAAADEVARAGQVAAQQMRADSLSIDLSGVTFMDSTGLSALVTIRNESVRLGKELTVCNVPAQVRQILAITGLDGVLTVVDQPATGSVDSNLTS